MSRDEYIAKLKSQLDQWNAELANWEAKMESAQAGMKGEYQRQLEVLRQNREAALSQMAKIQQSSADAWLDLMRGADDAWKKMHDAFANARSHFDKK